MQSNFQLAQTLTLTLALTLALILTPTRMGAQPLAHLTDPKGCAHC